MDWLENAMTNNSKELETLKRNIDEYLNTLIFYTKNASLWPNTVKNNLKALRDAIDKVEIVI